MYDVEDKFNLSAERYDNFCNRVCIAVSGGSDSIALTLLALNRFNYIKNSSLVAVTVDHGLRKESLEEAYKVNSFLKLYGIEHHIISWDSSKITGNISARARDARYKILSEFCLNNKADCVMTGHTMQDQAETVLMNAFRGSGVEGLSGMSDKSFKHGVCFLRPMLEIGREELREWLTSKNISWIDDPSNENRKYKRVEIRKFLEAQNNKDAVIRRLSNTSKYMFETRKFIEKHCHSFWINNVAVDDFGCGYLNTDAFLKEDKAIGFRVLTKLLKVISGNYYPPRSEKSEILYNLIMAIKERASESSDIFKATTLGGCYIFYRKKTSDLIFLREEKHISDIMVKTEECKVVVWDNRYNCSLSDLKEDFEISALGAEGLNFIKDKLEKKFEKILKKILYVLPAFKKDNEIKAVPLLGYYESENFKEKIKCSFYKYKDFGC